jgi:hypothetical protein
LSSGDRAKIEHQNAARVFHVRLPARGVD